MSAESMERIVPELLQDGDEAARLSLKLHLERYRFACEHLVPGTVLDIACGTGYGTRLLAECSNAPCTGVDISGDAIGYAASRNAHANTRFVSMGLMDFRTDQPFANVVSLETIEHIPDPAKVVGHLSSLLAPGGHLVASAPVTPSVDANPFHVNDFTAASFRKLFLENGFTEVAALTQVQPYSLREIALRKASPAAHLRQGLLKFYARHPGKFFLRIRSLLTDGLNNRYLVVVMKKKI